MPAMPESHARYSKIMLIMSLVFLTSLGALTKHTIDKIGSENAKSIKAQNKTFGRSPPLLRI
jgi:hypothetical protein